MEIEMGLEEVCSMGSPDVFSVIPKSGVFLGLDISERSSGVCICSNGMRSSYNFVSKLPKNMQHEEVLLRRELKDSLRSIILGKCFDVVILEDVFQGVNPKTTRVLYALNTAIDELILDGEVSCGKFIRLDNGLWKSGLFSLDSDGLYKGMSDKLRIEKCLAMLGVYESGEGYQDRLDALGMLVGYFLKKSEIEEKLSMKNRKRVSFLDICYSYQEDLETIVETDECPEMLREKDKEFFPSNRVSKKAILDCLTKSPEVLFRTEEGINLGKLCGELNLPILPNGGCFAAWVKPEKLYKYVGGE